MGCWLFHKWERWVHVRDVTYATVWAPDQISRRAKVQSRTCSRCGFTEYNEQEA
jgi:hypothetical protein